MYGDGIGYPYGCPPGPDRSHPHAKRYTASVPCFERLSYITSFLLDFFAFLSGENTRMRPDEIEDSVKEARELAETFSAIADVLEHLLPQGEEASS